MWDGPMQLALPGPTRQCGGYGSPDAAAHFKVPATFKATTIAFVGICSFPAKWLRQFRRVWRSLKKDEKGVYV